MPNTPSQPNKTRIKAWVDALRSGEYIQAEQFLRDFNIQNQPIFCCLGVACDLSGVGEWDDINYKVKGIKTSTFMPPEVQEYYGLDTGNPTINGTKLSEYNDNLRYSFAQIADLIESKYLQN